jgi:hypothetical protein
MLKHHADAGAQLRQVGLGVADGNAGDVMAPSWNGSSPLTHLMSVDLPEPDGPHTTSLRPWQPPSSNASAPESWGQLLTLLTVIMGGPQRMIATRLCRRRTSSEATNEITK